MPSQVGTRTRQFHSRNLANKHGQVCRPHVNLKLDRDTFKSHKKHRSAAYEIEQAQKAKIYDQQTHEVVIVGHPSKSNQIKNKLSEMRFSIPNCPANTDIFVFQYIRAHELLEGVLHELKTCSKVMRGATDDEHVTMLFE